MNNCSICYKNLNSVYCCEYKLDTMYLYTYILTLFDTLKSFVAECSFHTTCLKALLHYATCFATCLTILLRHKLQAKLQGVTCLAIIKSRNIFVARSIARSRIRFYFSQRLPQRCNTFFRHCTV